jgi:hypothetical protein
MYTLDVYSFLKNKQIAKQFKGLLEQENERA